MNRIYIYLRSLVITALTCFVHIGQCQTLQDQFDALLDKQFPANEPGTVTLVAKDGEIIYKKALGLANVELNVPMATDMVFRIGSMTKQFTAVSILMLAEQGKLELNDPITKYIPDYPTHGHELTIHHLLTHTSGIANSTTLNPWDAHVRKKDFEPKALVDYFKNEPIKTAPGEQYQYNNFGYHILGYLIEIVSEMSYGAFVEKNIFQPLGMGHSYYGSHEAIIPNRATGYTRTRAGFEHAEYISMTQPYAAGALMSTVQDQLIWINALLDHRLISKQSLELAWSNYDLNNGNKINYGYGWFINDINGSRTVEHAGGISGYQTNAIYVPEENVFVVVFTNCDRTDPRPVSTRMAALAIGKPYPAAESIIELSDDQLEQWVGEYEYPDGSTRIVELIDNWLYWSRPGRYKFRLLPSAGNRFLLENTFTQVEFVPTEGSVKVLIVARIVRREANKID
jgi:CubicO group peptidase (beta-lactamase class C family)